MSEFAKRLKSLKGNWKKAQARPKGEGSFECPVEDGVYKARITTAELGESQNNRLQIKWCFTIAEGEGKGQQVYDYDGLETEDNLYWLQQKLARLGKEAPTDPEEIEAVLKEIEKERPLVRIRIKTKDEYTHAYINKLLEGDAVEEDPEGEEVAEPEAEAEEGAEAEAEPEAEPEAEEEGVSLEAGMKVKFSSGGKELEGEILEFVDDDSKARVKTEKGVFKVAVDKLEPMEGESEPEEEPAPKKSTKTKGSVKRVGSKK